MMLVRADRRSSVSLLGVQLIIDAGRFWRPIVRSEAGVMRSLPFSNWTVLMTVDNDRSEGYKRLLEAGGANVTTFHMSVTKGPDFGANFQFDPSDSRTKLIFLDMDDLLEQFGHDTIKKDSLIVFFDICKSLERMCPVLSQTYIIDYILRTQEYPLSQSTYVWRNQLPKTFVKELK